MVIFFAKVVIIFDIYKKSRDFSPLLIFLFWRRERDSNPRSLSAQRFSRPPQSTTLPSLQRAQNTRFSKSAAKVQQILDIRKFFCKKMVECLQFSVLLVLFGHLFDGRDIVVILRCNLLNVAFILRICYVYVTYILRK